MAESEEQRRSRSGRQQPRPARLHFNCPRRRTARSPRPGEEPRASRTLSARGGDRRAWLAAGSRRRGANATAHLARCWHVCTGLTSATACCGAWPAKGREPFDPGHPSESGGRGLFHVPHPRRGWWCQVGAMGGGAWRGGPGRLDKSAAGGWLRPERLGAVTLRCC